MLFLESSALLKRYIDEPETTSVLQAMQADPEWIASALAHAETALALCHAALSGDQVTDTRRRLDDDWQRFRVLPVDDACLLHAVEIGCNRRIRTLDAIHLAAADRLPRPFTFLTFDRRQAEAAREIGLEVLGVLGVETSPPGAIPTTAE